MWNPEWSPEYALYHARVVDACVELMGQNVREFFDEQCDYFEEFECGDKPEDVAQNQYEAMT
jgi:hypothetical protein